MILLPRAVRIYVAVQPELSRRIRAAIPIGAEHASRGESYLTHGEH